MGRDTGIHPRSPCGRNGGGFPIRSAPAFPGLESAPRSLRGPLVETRELELPGLARRFEEDAEPEAL
jgi:hypothetical protein